MFFFVCASLQCCIPGWILWCRHLCKYSLMCMLSLYITRVILFASLLPSLTLFCLFTIPCLSERIEKNISHIGRPFCSLHLSLFSGAELTLQSNAEWMQKDVKNVWVCEGASPFLIEVQRKNKAKQKHYFANPHKLLKKNIRASWRLLILEVWKYFIERYRFPKSSQHWGNLGAMIVELKVIVSLRYGNAWSVSWVDFQKLHF